MRASRPSRGALASAALLAASALLTSVTADAFCRTTTVLTPPGYDPSAIKDQATGEIYGCYDVGLVLYWANACVSYDVQESASKQIPYAVAAEDIAVAFSKWTGTTCPNAGDGEGRVSIDVRDFGPVECGKVEYNQYGPNQHAIVFDDDGWPHNDSSNTLALTTVTYDKDTGEIYDADMEINSAMYMLSTTPTVPEGGYDFESIVTHETGHFLGLAHSQDDRATMYAHYAAGDEVMRDLTEDDVDGICNIYAPGGLRRVAKQASPNEALPEEACDPTPRHGFTRTCDMGSAPSSSSTPSCTAARPDGPYGARDGLAWLGALVVGSVVRRRRARR